MFHQKEMQTITNLIAMQSTHAPLNLRSAEVPDIVAFLMLDKGTSKEPNHVGCVEKNVGFIKRHALVQSPSQMFNPDSVLPTHVFLLAILLLFAPKQ